MEVDEVIEVDASRTETVVLEQEAQKDDQNGELVQSSSDVELSTPFTSQESAVAIDCPSNRVATLKLVEIDISELEDMPQTNGHAKCHPIAGEDVEMPSTSSIYFQEKTVAELSRYSWRGSTNRQRFLKGCHWSPDGTCVLTSVNGDGMHVVELPRDLYATESVSPERPLDVLQSAVHVKEGGTVYDYCWYPFMNSSEPASCW